MTRPTTAHTTRSNAAGASCETHWNGALLDALDAVCGFTTSMTWKGVHPVVALVTTTYTTGVTLTKEAMAAVEAHLTRLPHLAKWFVDIPYSPSLHQDM